MFQETGGGSSTDNEIQESCNDSIISTAEQLRLALRLSEQQQIEDEQRRLIEEETFRQVLELSLTDKWFKVTEIKRGF